MKQLKFGFIIGCIKENPNVEKLRGKMLEKNRKEFIVNKYISLKLEHKETNIYLNGQLFRQCKFLLLDIPIDEIRTFDEIDSIDEAEGKLDHSLEDPSQATVSIPPETEFWGHCSNLQVWAENGYDTRLIHRNLAFPLLRKLAEIGDPLAKKFFKEEVAKRFTTCHYPVMKFLIRGGFLTLFSYQEFITLLEGCIRFAGQDFFLTRNLSKVLIENDHKLVSYDILRFRIHNINNPRFKFLFQVCDKILSYSNILRLKYTREGLFNDLIKILKFKHKISIEIKIINNSEKELSNDTIFSKKVHELSLAVEWLLKEVSDKDILIHCINLVIDKIISKYTVIDKGITIIGIMILDKEYNIITTNSNFDKELNYWEVLSHIKDSDDKESFIVTIGLYGDILILNMGNIIIEDKKNNESYKIFILVDSLHLVDSLMLNLMAISQDILANLQEHQNMKKFLIGFKRNPLKLLKITLSLLELNKEVLSNPEK